MEVALQNSPFFLGVEYLAIFSCGMAGGLAAIRKGYDVFTIIITAWLTALGGGMIRDILLGVEYLAIFSCGMAGGLAAIRKGYDVFTIIITAWLTALGGGMIRDILLGAVPPVCISDRVSVITALLAGCTVAVIHPEVDKLKWSMLTIDALALGLFAVNGTSKGLVYNTSGMTAVFLGTFTAMGGGMIRDILLNEVPMVIRDRHWYIVPAVIGSMLTVPVWRWHARGFINGGGMIRDILLNEVPMVIRDRHWYIVPAVIGSMLTVPVWRWHARGFINDQVEMTLDVAIIAIVVLLRLGSVRFNWQLPTAVPRAKAHLPHVLLMRRVHHRVGDATVQNVPQPSTTQDGAAMESGDAQMAEAHRETDTHGGADDPRQ